MHNTALYLCLCFLYQLRTIKSQYAEASGYFGTTMKLIDEEISEKGACREFDEKLIQVSAHHLFIKSQQGFNEALVE